MIFIPVDIAVYHNSYRCHHCVVAVPVVFYTTMVFVPRQRPPGHARLVCGVCDMSRPRKYPFFFALPVRLSNDVAGRKHQTPNRSMSAFGRGSPQYNSLTFRFVP